MNPVLRRGALIALLITAIASCFLRLGAPPVYILNEAREGVYTRAMLDTGDFVLPRVPNHVENGEIIPDKPPLFHWLSAGATVVRGVLTSGRIASGPELSREYDEWTLRFPSALCGVLTVMAIALLGARLVGERAALLAAMALLASWQFVVQSHYGRVDMALACPVTVSMLLAGRALVNSPRLANGSKLSIRSALTKGSTAATVSTLVDETTVVNESERANASPLSNVPPGMNSSSVSMGSSVSNSSSLALVAAGAVAGLAVLAKGPLGLVLPALACGLWTLVRTWRERSIRWFPLVPFLGAVLACAVVALPWYLLAYHAGGEAFLRSQLLNENLQQGSGGNGRMDFFYYVGPWMSDGFPWNLIAVAACVQAWRTRNRGAAFCAIWWASFLMFFQFAAYKRGAYLLPALPVSALLAGWWLDQRLPRGESASFGAALASLRARLPAWWRIAACLVALGAIAGFFLVRLPALERLPAAIELKRPGMGEPIGVALPAIDGALALGGLVALFGAIALSITAWRRRDAWLGLVAAWVGLLALFLGVFQTITSIPALESSPKPLVARILADLPPGERVVVRGLGDDPSLPLLLAFPDPAQIEIVPARAPRPSTFRPGMYLFSSTEWSAIRGTSTASSAGWRELWSDTLLERGNHVPLVLVERLGSR